MSARSRRSVEPTKPQRRAATAIEKTPSEPDPIDRSMTPSHSQTAPLRKVVEEGITKTISDMLGPMTAKMMTCLPKDGSRRIFGLASEAIEQIAPNDPLERMLVEQLVWCHERVRRLALKATSLSDPARSAAIHAQCDATMNTFRRGMMALRQYRAMASPVPQVAIQQINEAGAGDMVVRAGR